MDNDQRGLSRVRRVLPAVSFFLASGALLLLLIVLPYLILLVVGGWWIKLSTRAFFDSPSVLVVYLLGVLWYAVLWRKLDPRTYRDRAAWGMVALSAAAYLVPWWRSALDPDRSLLSLRSLVAAFTVAVPAVNAYLGREIARSLRVWRRGERRSLFIWLRRGCLPLGAGAALVMTAGLWGVVVVASCHLYPRILDSRDTTEEYRRALCHRLLDKPWFHPHDIFVALCRIGDETSVPVLIEALRRGVPEDSQSFQCTWSHALSALKVLTNQDAHGLSAAWQEWYRKNGRQPRLEWIARGFKERGFRTDLTGNEESVREAFRAIAEDRHAGAEDNALRILAHYGKALVERVRAETVRNGTVSEKIGCGKAWEGAPREAEPSLRVLLADPDRTVRWTARDVLSGMQAEWNWNPPGFLEEVCAVGRDGSRGGWASDDGVVYFLVRGGKRPPVVAYDLLHRRELWQSGAACRAGGSIASDGCRLYFAGDDDRLYCLERGSGAVVWKAETGLDFIHEAPLLVDQYAVLNGDVWATRRRPANDAGPHLVVHEIGGGAQVHRSKGSVLGVHGGTAFCAQEGEVTELELKDLRQTARYEVTGECLGMGLQGEVAAFVVAREGGRVEVEGWSRPAGERIYSKTIRDEVDGAERRNGGGAQQLRNGTVLGWFHHYSFAADPADGRVLWESPVSGPFIECGDLLITSSHRGLTFLHPGTAEVLARYEVEGTIFLDRVYPLGGRIYAFSDEKLWVMKVPRP